MGQGRRLRDEKAPDGALRVGATESGIGEVKANQRDGGARLEEDVEVLRGVALRAEGVAQGVAIAAVLLALGVGEGDVHVDELVEVVGGGGGGLGEGGGGGGGDVRGELPGLGVRGGAEAGGEVERGVGREGEGGDGVLGGELPAGVEEAQVPAVAAVGEVAEDGPDGVVPRRVNRDGLGVGGAHEEVEAAGRRRRV